VILTAIVTLPLRTAGWLRPAGAPVSTADAASACGTEIWIGPVSGAARCELQSGHGKWHRSDEAGWEWCDGQLWPLPRQVA
jgi:hypothetical protein